MPVECGKKIIILYILTILRKYSDKNHPMTQQQIADRLFNEYGIQVHRATIKRNLADLMAADYGIRSDEVSRSYRDKATGEEEDSSICTNFYYEHEFSEAELHMLVDGLLFSRSVPYKERKALIDKLGDLSSSHFSKRIQKVHSMNSDSPQNEKLFVNIERLEAAILDGRQVEITYGKYGTDLQLHENTDADGKVKKHLLNPYQLVASDGRYYLICNKDNHEEVVNYRVDRIMSLKVLKTPAKPKSQVVGLENGLKLQEYVYQHVNMFSGEPEMVEFIVPEGQVGLVVDFFGKHASFFDRGDGTVSCHIKTSRKAMVRWAVQFGNIVRVVSPESLVEEIRKEIRAAAENYGME